MYHRLMRPEYREQPCKTALNQTKGMPFRWTLNPYMGCVHRCTYCYVRAYERRADRPFDERYGRSIRVKTNVAQVLRWASQAYTFGVPEVRLGLIPGWGGTSRLPHLLPKAIAAQMLLTGQAISAQEAHRLGLINEVVPKDKLMETAERWAQRLAEPGPLAVRAAKEVMLKTMSMTLEESLKLEWEKIMYLYTTADWEEGREAFISRRKANFQAK